MNIATIVSVRHKDIKMSDKILIIGKGVSQQLSPDAMRSYTQVKMVITSGQNALSLEVVSQMLFLQSQLNIKIEFLQIQGNSPDQEKLLLSFQFGLLLKDKGNEIAYLSNDSSIDNVIASAQKLGLKVNRITN